MKNMPPESIDFIATDPPYAVKYKSRDGRTLANDDNTAWLGPAYTEMYRVLKDNRFCVSFYGWNKVERFMHAWKKAGFRPIGHVVGVKAYASKTGFTSARHEMAYLLAKGEPLPPENPLSDVLTWRYTGNRLHPTQKPIEVVQAFIEAYSHKEDIVLDPFAGSGTTAVAALKLGRRYVAIELDEGYCAAAKRRLHAYQSNTKSMSYINDARKEVRTLLDETSLSDEEKKTIENHHAHKVLESYKNGVEKGERKKGRTQKTENEKPSA